jgi:hypothetical protein
MAIYLVCIYSDEQQAAWFRQAWQKTGKKLDMGKSCLRFKNIEDVPLKVIGQAIKRVPVNQFIEHYESVIQGRGGAPSRKTAPKAAPKKKRSSQKTAPTKKVASRPRKRKPRSR